MHISYNDLREFAVKATDGRKGHAKDLYFDHESWQVLYLVTESGFLFNKQERPVKSTQVEEPDVEARTVPVSLSKQQLDEVASPGTDPPVSESMERDIRRRRFDA